MINKKLELEIRNRLIDLSEEKYQKFSSALIPGCDNLIGVRIPLLRTLAKEISKECPYEYLNNTNEVYFEEVMLKGIIIGNLKDDLNTIFDQITIFVPKITNWSLCDTFCNGLKLARKYPKDFWNFLDYYLKSNNPYDIRFGVVMILCHFIEEDYLSDIFTYFDNITNTDYYVEMAIAWAVSMCYVKFPIQTHKYLLKNKMSDFTYNKSLQKICESTRIDKETKLKIKSMKR